MFIVLLLLPLLNGASQTVQVLVEAPRLPQNGMRLAGSFDHNRLYVDAESWERSNLPNLVGGTVVIVTPGDAAPLQVMRMWIDCDRRVYQLSPGRAYDVQGVEFAPTSYLPDQPVGTEGPVRQLADGFCVTPFGIQAMAPVADWRVALQETRAAAAQGVNP